MFAMLSARDPLAVSLPPLHSLQSVDHYKSRSPSQLAIASSLDPAAPS